MAETLRILSQALDNKNTSSNRLLKLIFADSTEKNVKALTRAKAGGKKSIKSIPQILEHGLRTSWDATWGLVVGLLLMFVMLPLPTLGSIYLIGRQARFYLEMPAAAEKMDAAGRHVLNKISSRSRSKMALSRG
jgi:hypothetical protein